MKTIETGIKLPNGSKLKNRIAKSAMSENMADRKHRPTKALINAYKQWAKANPGLLITGNIMIDSKALGEPDNVVVENRDNMSLLKEWAESVKGTDSELWVQINHPGRQAMEQVNKELVAPSAVPVKLPGRKSTSNKIPRELNETEILKIIERFGNTALILKDAGFTGVQIHGAHGYLVSQFLSPLSNIRKDKWGGSIENRARFVLEVYKSIRSKVGKGYPVGIKLNSADFQKGGFSEEESMMVVKMLTDVGIDLIEVSGGTYEAPVMTQGKQKESTRKREAFFLDYVEKVRKITDVPLMLTGGFRTLVGMEEALKSKALDMVGIARPFAVYPNLPDLVFNNRSKSFDVHNPNTGIKSIDGFMGLIWYEAQIKRLGEGKEPKVNLGAWPVFFWYLRKMIRKNFNRN